MAEEDVDNDNQYEIPYNGVNALNEVAVIFMHVHLRNWLYA